MKYSSSHIIADMNFKTIQRIDESVAEVIMMVHKVVVYQYSETSKTWVRLKYSNQEN